MTLREALRDSSAQTTVLAMAVAFCLASGTYLFYLQADRADGAYWFNQALPCWDGSPLGANASGLSGLSSEERDALIAAAQICGRSPGSALPPGVASLMGTLTHRVEWAQQQTVDDAREDADQRAMRALSR